MNSLCKWVLWFQVGGRKNLVFRGGEHLDLMERLGLVVKDLVRMSLSVYGRSIDNARCVHTLLRRDH